MRVYIIIVLFALTAVSCGRSDGVAPDTSQPQQDREGAIFHPPIQLFAGDYLAPAIDADIGEVLNGPGTGGDIGTPSIRRGDPWVTQRARQASPIQDITLFSNARHYSTK